MRVLTSRFSPDSPSSHQPGQSVVEFGLIAVLFLVLFSFMFDFGRTLNAWLVISSAAREAGRVAAIGGSAEDVETAAQQFGMVPGLDPESIAVSLTYSPAPPPDDESATVEVTASAFEILTPAARAVFGCSTTDQSCLIPISSSVTVRTRGGGQVQ